MNTDEPWIDPDVLESANRRHDMEPHSVGMTGQMGNPWKIEKLTSKGTLSDRKIARYEKLGFYSEAFKAAGESSWPKRRPEAGTSSKTADA